MGPSEHQAIWIPFIFVAVVALSGAFVSQRILHPHRRTRIILTAAACPSAMLVLLLLISAFFFELAPGAFEIAFTLAFWFVGFFFVGLVAALIGTELASLSLWLRARKERRRGRSAFHP